MDYDVVIIGAGPGGLTSALYTARFGLKTLVLEKTAPGGQINLTEAIENYPGFDEPIFGYELSIKMEKQARKFGAEIKYEEVTEVYLEKEIKIIRTGDNEYRTKSVIISTGAFPKRLFIEGEEKYLGKGISFCGTCDAPLYKGKTVAVIGGGDTALEEAVLISRHAEKIFLIHRRDQFRGQKFLQDQVLANNKIEVVWNSKPVEIYGEELVKGIKIENTQTGNISDIPIDGLFIFIGHLPNVNIFKGQVGLGKSGFILTDKQTKTNIKGVFACGDVVEKELRQITISVGEGAQSAYEAYKYIEHTNG